MAVDIQYWLECEQAATDYYDLLGRERFDPDVKDLLKEIRNASRELLAYQNHTDPTVAQRAVKLQYELARASEAFGDSGKLRSHHEAILQRLRDEYTGETAGTEGRDTLQQWLAKEQRVHATCRDAVSTSLLHDDVNKALDSLDAIFQPAANVEVEVPEPRLEPELPRDAVSSISTVVTETVSEALHGRLKGGPPDRIPRKESKHDAPIASPSYGPFGLLTVPGKKLDGWLASLAGKRGGGIHNLLRLSVLVVAISGLALVVGLLMLFGNTLPNEEAVPQTGSQLSDVAVADASPTTNHLADVASTNQQNADSYSSSDHMTETELSFTTRTKPLGEPIPQGVQERKPTNSAADHSSALREPKASPKRPAAGDRLVSDLPELNGFVPRWRLVAGARARDIQAAREKLFVNLKRVEFSDFIEMGSARGSRGRRPPYLDLPDRFLLSGYVHEIRACDGKTWVFLRHSLDPRARNPLPYGRAPLIYLESGDENSLAALADYSAGCRVNVVVERADWGNDAMPLGVFPGGRNPSDAEAIRRTFRVFSVPHDSSQPGPPRMCFRCLAIGQDGNINTWFDVQRGRIAELANREELEHSLGHIFRNLLQFDKVKGTIRATFSQVRRTTRGLSLTLQVRNTVAGTIPLSAQLSKPMQVQEFHDYRPGDVVELEITIDHRLDNALQFRRHRRTAPGQREFPADPFSYWREVNVTCDRIQKLGDRSTLVSISGPRREYSGELLPGMTKYNPTAIGQTVSWSGRLEQVRRRAGETHVLVKLDEPSFGVSRINGFTTDPDFLDELADFVDDVSGRDNPDRVTLEAVVAGREDAESWLDTSAALLRIKSIRREGDRSVTITPGKERTPSSFDDNRMVSGLATVYRDVPPIGETVSFEADFQSLSGTSASLRSIDSSRKSLRVSLPTSLPGNYSDYRRDARVSVVAKVTGKPTSRTSWPEMKALEICRLGNRRSKVTSDGREYAPLGKKQMQSYSLFQGSGDEGSTATAIGIYRGFVQQDSHLEVKVQSIYSSSSSCTLLVQNTPENLRFLTQMNDGAEVQVRFVCQEVWMKQRSKKVRVLLSMARIDQPDKPLEFPNRFPTEAKVPASNTSQSASKSQGHGNPFIPNRSGTRSTPKATPKTAKRSSERKENSKPSTIMTQLAGEYWGHGAMTTRRGGKDVWKGAVGVILRLRANGKYELEIGNLSKKIPPSGTFEVGPFKRKISIRELPDLKLELKTWDHSVSNGPKIAELSCKGSFRFEDAKGITHFSVKFDYNGVLGRDAKR